MIKYLTILVILLQGTVVAQNKYNYEIRLNPQLSKYNASIVDSFQNGKATFDFCIKGFDGLEIPSVSIKIKGTKTRYFFYTGTKRLAPIVSASDTFDIIISGDSLNPLEIKKFVIPGNSQVVFTVTMSRSNTQGLAHISSQRVLSEKELKKIINDINNGKETELIKNKTCALVADN